MKKKLTNAIAALKKIANTLTDDAREFADAVVGALEQLEADAEEHNLDELADQINQLVESSKKAADAEEVAEKIQKLRNEVMGMLPKKEEKIADKFTQKVRNEIAHAMITAENAREAEAAAMEVCKRNEITGITFADVVDYTLNLKQEDNDELYAEFYQAVYNRFFVADLDPEDATSIAKQWNGLGVDVTEKDIQELAAEGKTINTKEIYKRQRVPNSVLDDVEAAGQESQFQNSITTELRKAVQGLQVRAALIGDKVNAAGKRVTTFETIADIKRTNLFCRVLAPATAGKVDLLDIRKAADAVKWDYKIAIMTSETKLALITRKYSTGATPILLTDEELAAQLGVNKVYTRDFIGDVAGLHAIVLNPREYWIFKKKEREIAFPQYEKNVLNFLYEHNAGGAIHGLESVAVVKEGGSSSSSASAAS